MFTVREDKTVICKETFMYGPYEVHSVLRVIDSGPVYINITLHKDNNGESLFLSEIKISEEIKKAIRETRKGEVLGLYPDKIETDRPEISKCRNEFVRSAVRSIIDEVLILKVSGKYKEFIDGE